MEGNGLIKTRSGTSTVGRSELAKTDGVPEEVAGVYGGGAEIDMSVWFQGKLEGGEGEEGDGHELTKLVDATLNLKVAEWNVITARNEEHG